MTACLAASAAAACGCSGGEAVVNYELSQDGTHYIVGGVSGNLNGLTEYEIPAYYSEEGGAELPVTEIGEGAFLNCKRLASVKMPATITSIGKNAFTYCAFFSVTIPESVTFIGYGAFGACTSLTQITVPQSVTLMEGHAFYGCSKLQKAVVKASVEIIPENAFSNFVYAEGGNAFTNSSLKEVYLSDSVQKIHVTAFNGDIYLEEIYFAGSEEQWNAVYFFDMTKNAETGEWEEVKYEKSEVIGDMSVHFNSEF